MLINKLSQSILDFKRELIFSSVCYTFIVLLIFSSDLSISEKILCTLFPLFISILFISSISKQIILVFSLFLSSRLIYELINIFDFKIAGSVGTQTALRISALSSGIILLYLFVSVFFKNSKIKKLDLYFLIYFGLWNFIACAIGISKGNSLTYLIGDTFNTLQVWLVFYSIYSIVDKKYYLLMDIWIVYIVLSGISELRYLFHYISTLINGDYSRIGGGNFLLFLISFSLSFSTTGYRKKICISGVLISFMVLILAAFRAKWVFALGGVIFILYLHNTNAFNTFVKSIKYCFLFSILFFSLSFLTSFELINKLKARVVDETISTYNSGKMDLSNSIKIWEITRVLDKFESEPNSLIYGFGNGAEFDINSGTIAYILDRWGKRGKIHNIHNTYFAIFFRHGIIGLTLFLSFIILFLFKAKRITKYLHLFSENKFLYSVGAFCFTYLLISLVAFSQDYYLGVYLGLQEWGLLFASIFLINKYIEEKIKNNTILNTTII